MLILYDNQEEIIKRTISKYVHGFYSGKLKSNFDSFTLSRQWHKGYSKSNMRGFVQYIRIENTNDNKVYTYYTVDIALKDGQKHTYYVKIDTQTNRIEYR